MLSPLSVVVVNYKAGEILLRCLASLGADEATREAEIVVVDNASGDDSLDRVGERFPAVRVIANARNEGFPVAANQGIAAATGEYVLLLNPDAEIRPGSASKLLAYAQAHPDAGIAGPRLVHPDGAVQASAWRVPTAGGIFVEYVFGQSTRAYADLDADGPTDVESLSGAALLFRRDFFLDLGGLDPDLFWIEDVDLCVRVRRAGKRVVYFPEAEMVHHQGVSARKNHLVAISNQIFNKIKFMRKYGTRFDQVVVTWISFAHVLAKAAVLTALSPLGAVYADKARAYRYTAPRVFDPPRRGGGIEP
jgi:GT2 family glycosyltransferase